MLASVRSAAVLGVDAYRVTVEADVAPGLPQWTIVGLASGAVRESRERVSAALANCGLALPPRRITVSLSPGDTVKSGTGFDLPIALALLAAVGGVLPASLEHIVAVGELGLDGSIRPVRGVLPVARLVHEAGDGARLVVPERNAAEASLARGPLTAVSSLGTLVSLLRSGALRDTPVTRAATAPDDTPDLRDVVGQESARRALEISAAGGHAALLVGPPGAGKTMLARRLPGILPSLGEREALEVTAIHSVAGLLADGAIADRPFRAPHHTVSVAGLVGGGSGPRPGEVSLAHRGVLFLDELLEFPRGALEALRQPLEDGRVVIARAQGAVRFPARFALVAAANPCPCGYAGDDTRACVCAERDVVRYRSRLSGPLADRIDLHVTVAALPIARLSEAAPGESSADVRARVESARDAQRRRYRSFAFDTNAAAPGGWLLAHGCLTTDAKRLATAAAERKRLSGRAFHRVVRVARTIADLAGASHVESAAIAEAIALRGASWSEATSGGVPVRA